MNTQQPKTFISKVVQQPLSNSEMSKVLLDVFDNYATDIRDQLGAKFQQQ